MEERALGTEPIIPYAATPEALAKLCPDLQNWPQSWCIESPDIALGEHIVTFIKPFLLHLLGQDLATKTLRRHRDHLWMLGGEIIRRRHEDSTLRRISIENILLHLLSDEGGPLIWPRLSEEQQEAFDATCRKLHRFLYARAKKPRGPEKMTHKFR